MHVLIEFFQRLYHFDELIRWGGHFVLVAIVFADSPKFPKIDEETADFTYARLMGTESKIETGYPPKAIKEWAEKARAWEGTGKKKRDVFVYMISGAKERAPAAAMALLKELK